MSLKKNRDKTGTKAAKTEQGQNRYKKGQLSREIAGTTQKRNNRDKLGRN